MTPDEAKKHLLQATLTDEGLYLQLRLGLVPSADEIVRLRTALRVLWHATVSSDRLPRDIAYSCAIILNFAEECYGSLRQRHPHRSTDLENIVRNIAQGAFEVLAGDVARQWMVPRPDLGDPIE